MLRISAFLVTVLAAVGLFMPSLAHALVVQDDFESYSLNAPINGTDGWASDDTFYGIGWIVTNDHPSGHKYLRFWPSPWPGSYTFDTNSVTWHVTAGGQVVGLRLSMNYFIQTNGDCKVLLSGDNTDWIDITSGLSLQKDDAATIHQASADLTDLVDDANIASDVYVRFRAAASSGTSWVAGLDAIALEITEGYNISGVVYEDSDDDYLYDAGETPIANAQVWAALDGRSIRDVASATSRMVGPPVWAASDGSFALSGLPSGAAYDVVVSVTGNDLSLRPGETLLVSDETGWNVPVSSTYLLQRNSAWKDSLLPDAVRRGELKYCFTGEIFKNSQELRDGVASAFDTWRSALSALGVDVRFEETTDMSQAYIRIGSEPKGDPFSGGEYAHTHFTVLRPERSPIGWRGHIVFNDFTDTGATRYAWKWESDPAVRRFPESGSPPTYWTGGWTTPNTYGVDIESSALHEIGHLLGLTDVSLNMDLHGETDFTVVMDYARDRSSPNYTEWRHVLGWGDIEGIRAQLNDLR